MRNMGEQKMENGHAASSRTLTPSSPHATTQHDSTSASSNASNGRNGGKTQYTYEYLSQLLKDKKQLEAFPNVFHHLERLADEEISKVRVSLFQFEFAKDAMSNLPEPEGEVTTMTEKIFVPVKEHPDYNFVGRILGPRGMTAKQLEQETGCKIMVRGKGSMRDKAKEEANRGKPNWEHLSEDLHVLIQCEDAPNRAVLKLKRAAAEVRKLLVPSSDDDELKRKQLMELAIINGTYRSGSTTQTSAAQAAAVASKTSLAALQARLIAPMPLAATQPASLRSPTLAGAPIILSPSRGAAGGQTAANAAAAAALAAQLQAVANQQQQNAAAAAFTQQAAAAAAAAPAAVAAGIPAHLLQPQTLTQGDYGQLYINSIPYDPTGATYAVPVSSAAAATFQAQQQQYAAAAAAAMLGATPYIGDYSTVDLSHAGAMLCNQRRVLGQSREHPYASGKSSTS
uniref:K Homology domain-containing protein n=2 Tax=Ascarididae TaxID=6250 RepID=A0A915B1H7_PARUN